MFALQAHTREYRVCTDYSKVTARPYLDHIKHGRALGIILSAEVQIYYPVSKHRWTIFFVEMGAL